MNRNDRLGEKGLLTQASGPFLWDEVNRWGKIFIPGLALFFCMSEPGWGQKPPLDEELKAVSNHVMLAIYDDLIAMRAEDELLQHFSPDALTQNPFGIYKIEYSNEAGIANETKPFAFGLTIAPSGETIFEETSEGIFNYYFDLLNVNLTGYVTEFAERAGFHLEEFLQRHGQLLLDEQQRRLPLQLTLTAGNNTFKLNQEIELMITLKNASNYHIRTKGLNTETVHFWVDGELLVADEAAETAAGEMILKSGQSFSRSFRLQGFKTPGKAQIFCSYNMVVEDVHPVAYTKITVVE